MTSVHELKRRSEIETPLLLFECQLRDGTIERWSTHRVDVGGVTYEGRVLRHNAFEMRLASDDGIDAAGRMSVTLANADSRFSQLERSVGFKGAKLTVRFVFYDLDEGRPASEAIVIFLGSANPADEITEATIRLSFMNRLSLQRVTLPSQRIQARCPWMFPSTAQQRSEAVAGGPTGAYSRFFGCGYSADQESGCGNLNSGEPFASCNFTRSDCAERGMFDRDSSGNMTARFAGFEFLPPSIAVRSHGEKGSHTSPTADGRGRANDAVPLIYGTAWYQAPVVFSRNDGNLTHCEVLLGSGEIEAVHKVLVNGVEIPIGVAGKDMGATGWYNVVSRGDRNGGFNLSFTDKAGNPLGDPHGGMAMLSVAAPNRVYDGTGNARVEVLIDGLRLERFDRDGSPTGKAFTRNPAWVLLDLLRRSGWTLDEVSIGSFAATAEYCDELIPAKDIHGNDIHVPKFECNIALTQRRSAAELIRGVRTAAALLLTFSAEGRLELAPEGTLSTQHPAPRLSSNAVEPLDGGWPAYEFGDGLNGSTGILQDSAGAPRLRLWSKSVGETPNRVSVEFQNALNEYQQDSVSLVDLDDIVTMGQELSATLPALGLPHSNQALRVSRFHLMKGLRGNQFVEFDTSVHALGLRPGDLITVTYLKEGFDRAPFRVQKLVPSSNYETVRVTAQKHDDAWYELLTGASPESIDKQRQSGRYGTLPRPIAGAVINEDGEQEFEIVETPIPQSDGTTAVQLKVRFTPPATPDMSGAGVPIVGLSPQIIMTDGSLPGGKTYYYAVSAIDGNGGESDLSFVVRASIPSGSDTNCVRLRNISVHANAVSLRVYRGDSPHSLLMIEANAPRSTEFVDIGFAQAPVPPPDPNYDHANFHWRNEFLSEIDATLFDERLIGSSTLSMLPNEYRGAVVRITSGKGAGQERLVLSNGPTSLLIATPWLTMPDVTSTFAVSEASWRFGAATRSSEAQFDVPNRADAFVQISGRAANALDVETPSELSLLHRHRIGGGGSHGSDADVPPAPTFGLSVSGRGQVDLLGVGFEDLTNTRTVSAGTLTLHYWNELDGQSSYALAAPVAAADEWLILSASGTALENDLIQIGMEILKVLEVQADGTLYRVERGACGSFVSAHNADEVVWHLMRHVVVAPFPLDFFGTPASGAFVFSVPLKDARVAAAEFFVTNMRGDSPVVKSSYTQFIDHGLRTLAGGQYSVQLVGEPALESNVAPPLLVDETRSIGDVLATLSEPPVGGATEVRLRVEDRVLCDLVIPPGSRNSQLVSGAHLPVLQAGWEISMDVIAVPYGAGSRPGRNLNVTIRL